MSILNEAQTRLIVILIGSLLHWTVKNTHYPKPSIRLCFVRVLTSHCHYSLPALGSWSPPGQESLGISQNTLHKKSTENEKVWIQNMYRLHHMVFGSHVIFACNFKLPSSSTPISTCRNTVHWLAIGYKKPPRNRYGVWLTLPLGGRFLAGQEIWCVCFPVYVIISICYCNHFKMKPIEMIWLWCSLTTENTEEK